MIDKAVFFKEATCQLLQTLNLQKGLERLQLYISEYIPCGEIRFSCFPSFSTAPGKNLHIRACNGVSSVYYGSPLTKDLLENLLSLAPSSGEIIDDPNHPLVQFCASLNASGHGLMPLPWYDLVLWDNDELLGECRFSGYRNRPFNKQNCELLDSLRPVLCIALSNYKKFLNLQAANHQIKKENLNLRQALTGIGNTEIIGAQGGLKQVMERVRLVARHDVSVLIGGETGTGKELVARMIHNLSPRREKPFIAINCGVIPSSLIDSELFGYIKGSFTGASHNYKGYFERASGGTFFLDEVAELPLDVQVRLLRVLQEQEVQPLGSDKTVHVDVRIVAATNKDLKTLTREGKFRSDLYYRLRGVHILLPPLRNRKEDIPDLVQHVIGKFSEDMGIKIPELAAGEMEKLIHYAWPGNIRELKNIIMEALISTSPGIPLYFNIDPFPPIATASPSQHQEILNFQTPDFGQTSSEVMSAHYLKVLSACNWRIKGQNGAAAILGINPSTLRFRIKKLGLKRPDKLNISENAGPC